MTYSHNSVGNNNLEMTTVASTTKAERATGGEIVVSNGVGGKQNSHFINNINNNNNNNNNRRRTPPIATSTVNNLAFDINISTNNDNALHSNSIACSTNMQQHPLMSGSPSNASELGSTPGSGSFFGSQRKQRFSQWQSPNNEQASVAGGGGGGGGGAFFHKNNNYTGQNSSNTNKGRRQQQRDERQQRTPSANLSPATVLGGGTASDSSEKTATSTGRKRRPKFHFQSPIITAPADLGVGGNISPTHPLLPAVLTHFAGSKCFDAPAPSAVPKPPQHWMQTGACLKAVKPISAAAIMGGSGGRDVHTLAGHVVKSSKRNLLDDFDTHNLKLLLNVQA